MLALPLSPLLSILLGVFELGLWGVLQKIAVLNTHCIVRSTDKQCAAWISRILRRATNWVTLVTGLIHECLQPDLGLAAPSLPVASTLPPGKNCRRWALVLVVSKIKVKPSSHALLILLQPCGQCTGAVPFLQLPQGSRNTGYCETGAFWVGWTV